MDMDVVYNEEEACESKEHGTSELYRGMLPACGMLPTLQIPYLHGLPIPHNNDDPPDSITKLDNNALTDVSLPEVKMVSDEDYSMTSSEGDICNVVPTTNKADKDVKGGILLATDKVGINLLGGNELDVDDTVKLLIGDEIDINLPIGTEPDGINIINAKDNTSYSNVGVKIITKTAAATKIQRLFK